MGWFVYRAAQDAERVKIGSWYFRRVSARRGLHQQSSRTNGSEFFPAPAMDAEGGKAR